MKGNGTKITALYCRLSQDDGNVGDSMSIQSQKAILEKYARDMGKAAYAFYVDDGYSGTNFQRPSFQRMIADIEDGKIDTVITKDLSRLGRNYLESGAYIEVFFPQRHVRYIAVNDGVDSEQSGGLDITPFKNILNEFYSRDISKKVKSGKHIRALEGKFMGTTAPFGYRKDPQDKNHLIVDEATAPTVRLIYSLALEGYGTNRIGKVLYERKIPKPSYFKQEFFSQHDSGSEDYWYDWKQEVITRILRNEKYIGDALLQKTYTVNTLEKKRVANNGLAPKYYVEGSHEAIIDKDIFLRVQAEIVRRANILTDGKKRVYSSRYALSSIVFCGHCGDIFRRVKWNNRGCKSTVWRCVSRVLKKSSGIDCPARTIHEEVLQAAVVTAVNDAWSRKYAILPELRENIRSVLEEDTDAKLAEIDEEVK
jgi:DNA invertase Pin-like site-specific DNA recombinase